MADFEEILRNIGEFGLFQQLTLLALSFPNLIQSFVFASFLFVEFDPERHCNTAWILQADSELTPEEQLNLTVPHEEDGSYSRCQMFKPVDWNISTIRENGLNETIGCQNGWVYINTMFNSTVVTDFDLVCGGTNLVEFIQSVFMAGVLIGSLIFLPFAESFGRKRANQIPVVIMFIFIIAAALSPNIYLYLVFQLLVGVGVGGYRVSSILLVTEWMGVSKQSLGALVTQLFDAVGQCILATVIYIIRDWRVTQLIPAAPLALVVFYIWFIPESAQWLLNRGKTEEAKRLIMKAAAVNKRTVPDYLLDKIAVKEVENQGGIRVIYRSSVLMKYLVILVLAWFASSLASLCLYFNMANFGMSIFLTQFLFGTIEVPAHTFNLWLLEVLGRRKLFISTTVLGGLSCSLILVVPQGNGIVVTALVVMARFLLMWGATLSNVYIQELFPTSVSQTASGVGATAARIGGLLAPLLNMLTMYHRVIPITVFSSLTIISGALGFLLPDISRKDILEYTDESEKRRTETSANTASCSTKL
ncbi:solute carrier family 22 member 13-like [Notolabrus celidotus]|uniref:solute carrier family 22 member 13-like n=1 Tax=Notolabrus celidotus TaxID=1203425 RepID=UPI0014904CF9|nr:solute carrier family 22 member 13-like [Notolabrus celidotus]